MCCCYCSTHATRMAHQAVCHQSLTAETWFRSLVIQSGTATLHIPSTQFDFQYDSTSAVHSFFVCHRRYTIPATFDTHSYHKQPAILRYFSKLSQATTSLQLYAALAHFVQLGNKTVIIQLQKIFRDKIYLDLP